MLRSNSLTGAYAGHGRRAHDDTAVARRARRFSLALRLSIPGTELRASATSSSRKARRAELSVEVKRVFMMLLHFYGLVLIHELHVWVQGLLLELL